MLDYLILGAGPGGLQLGYFLDRAGNSYRILEAGEDPGTFFATFPRHRQLLSINKLYTGYEDPEINLRWDWNSLLSDSERMLFKNYSRRYLPTRDELRTYLRDFAQEFALDIEYRTRIVDVRKNGGFILTDDQGREFCSRRLIVATGLAKSYLPPVPGIELAENYSDISTDPEEYAAQRILIIGKGNSAFETADSLIPTASRIHLVSPNPVRMAWRSHFVGHLRAVNNSLLDTYQLKSQNAVLDATIENIERCQEGFKVRVAYAHAHGEHEELCYDRLIACTGFSFDASIFDKSAQPRLCLDQRLPALTSEWESTNIRDLFFVGTLTQSRDYKKTTSAFIHGFRYNTRALFHILQQRYHGVPWPHRAVPNTPEALRDAFIERMNRSSALWQQFGFLADVILISTRDNQAQYYEEVPVDYLRAGGLLPGGQDPNGHHIYVMTLDYGNEDLPDPFHVLRIERNDVDHADQSQFLHPVVRHLRGAEQLAEHHVIEDLAAEWLEEVHRRPLLEFFQQERERLPLAS